jgi:hypothetical protein
MTKYFAKVEDGIVRQTIVAEQDFINTLPDAQQWIETFKPDENGLVPFRKNFGCEGSSYDANLDVFIPKRHFASWSLDTETYQWVPPIPMPTDRKYMWNEDTLSWHPKLTIEEITALSQAQDVAKQII